MAKDRKTSRAQVGLRVSEEMRQRLEDAATSNGRSINSEIVSRLDRSFETEDRLGGPGLSALVETIATVMKSTGEHGAFMADSSKLHNQGEWLAQPYGFEQAKQAAEAIIEAHRPPGKIVEPNPRMVFGGVGKTKADPKALAAQMREVFKNLGRLMAAGELEKRKQDNE